MTTPAAASSVAQIAKRIANRRIFAGRLSFRGKPLGDLYGYSLTPPILTRRALGIRPSLLARAVEVAMPVNSRDNGLAGSGRLSGPAGSRLL